MIVAGGREPATTGAEGNSGDLLLVASERDTVRRQGVVGQRASVPEADGVIVTGGREPVAVGTEGQAGDEAGVGEDRQHLAAGNGVRNRSLPI